MEAGNRCFDDRVPEEVNRRVIDHSSDVLMPYTERSQANLLREGIAPRRASSSPATRSTRCSTTTSSGSRPRAPSTRLGVEPRAVPPGDPAPPGERRRRRARSARCSRARRSVASSSACPIVFSVHPRTRERIDAARPRRSTTSGCAVTRAVRLLRLRRPRARGALRADRQRHGAGGVLHLRRPDGHVRDVTERPETIECGSNILSGADADAIGACVRVAVERAAEAGSRRANTSRSTSARPWPRS